MTTASEENIKRYLAYWFQLGKRVIFSKEGDSLLPKPIFEGTHYSQSFEECWQRILSSQSDSYLEGTDQTIQQLLSPVWEIVDCSRCSMPVPVQVTSTPFPFCPCQDIPDWPNFELPLPRSPVDIQISLNNIHQRLEAEKETE